MNNNEEFKRSLIIKLIEELNIDYNQQIKVEELITNLLQEYTVNKISLELTISDIPEKITMYLQAKRLEGVNENTLQNYFYLLRKLSAKTHKQVKDINLNDLRAFIYEECKGNKESTINSKVIYLQNFFKWLVDEEIIDKDPSRKLPQLKVPKRLRHALSIEEIERLRIACVDTRERALIELLFSTGCRLSELVQINKQDINYVHNSINVIGKGNKERTIFFNDKTKVHLENYLNSRKDYCEALFATSKRPFKRLEKRGVQDALKKIAKRAGFDKSIYPHIFRHSFASLGLQNGASIVTIQNLLGHSSITTTERYAETSMNNIKHEYNQSINL